MFQRKELLAKYQAAISSGEAIVGGGAETGVSLADAAAITDRLGQAAMAENPDIIVLVHGGPVASPEEEKYALANTNHCHGFYGASSMERLPTEIALTDQTKKFKAMSLRLKGKKQ